MARILFPDISDHQPDVNLTTLTRWQRKKFGAAFVVLKAAERTVDGTDWISPRFKSRWQKLDHLAEVRGTYFFANVGDGSPKHQADLFWNVVHEAGLRRHKGRADVLILDAERDVKGGDLSPRQSRLFMGEILAHLDARSHAAINLRPAWLYGGQGWLYGHLSRGKIDRYLWASSYTSERYAVEHVPSQFSWKPSLFVAQQFTGDGQGPEPHSIPGVPGNSTDLSYFRGDAKRLLSVAGAA